jgi:hypothetical protein
MTLKWSPDFNPPAQGHIIYTIDTTTGGTTPSNVDFNLRTLDAVNYKVVWEDSIEETSTSNTLLHTYGSPGTYSVQVFPTGTYRPYFNNVSADVDQLIKVSIGGAVKFPNNFTYAWLGADRMTEFECNFNVTSNVTSMYGAWQNCSSLASLPLIDTSACTDFARSWQGCSSLTSFPLIDTSSGTAFTATWFGCNSLTSFPAIDTSAAITLGSTWYTCNSLTSFPLIDTSSATNLAATWYGCNSLTSFPAIDTSNATTLLQAWRACSSLTSFPLLSIANVTSFNQTWFQCSSLIDFPANFFDSWTATPANGCFLSTWLSCTSLSATSVENILNSIDTSGRSAPASNVDITISFNAASGTPNISTAVASLKSRGWTITLNGVLQ